MYDVYPDQPDLDPDTEYALLYDEARDALQRAGIEDAAAYMLGSRGRSLVVAAGVANLSTADKEDKRTIILTDSSGFEDDDCRMLQVFGGMSANAAMVVSRIMLDDEGYVGEPQAAASDANVFAFCRYMLDRTEFKKDLAEGMCRGILRDSIGDVNDQVPLREPPESGSVHAEFLPESTRMGDSRLRRAGIFMSRAVRRLLA